LAIKKLAWHEYALGRLATSMVGIMYDLSQTKEKVFLAYVDMLQTCEMPVAEAHRLAGVITWMPITLRCLGRVKLAGAVETLIEDLLARKGPEPAVPEEPERIMPAVIT